MRTLSILLLSVALAASAGCFGKDDGGDGTPTPTTPGGNSTPTTSTPTTTTPATNTTPTTPVRPAPRELCALTFDFTQNTQAGPPPTHVSTADCGTSTAGYTTLTLNGNFSAAGGAPVVLQQGIAVSIVDAAGTVVATCPGPAPGPATVTPCTGSGSVTAGTAYTVRYDGVGPVTFSGSAVVS